MQLVLNVTGSRRDVKNFYIVQFRNEVPSKSLSIDIGRSLGLEYQLTDVVNGFRHFWNCTEWVHRNLC